MMGKNIALEIQQYISRARIAIETIADSFNDRFLAEEFRVHANNLRTAYDLLSAYGDFKEVQS